MWQQIHNRKQTASLVQEWQNKQRKWDRRPNKSTSITERHRVYIQFNKLRVSAYYALDLVPGALVIVYRIPYHGLGPELGLPPTKGLLSNERKKKLKKKKFTNNLLITVIQSPAESELPRRKRGSNKDIRRCMPKYKSVQLQRCSIIKKT